MGLSHLVSLRGIDLRTVDEKGRIVLPRFWIKTLKLKTGMYVTVQLNDVDNSLIIKKAKIEE